MNFDFSADLRQVREQARSMLAAEAAGSARRAIEDGGGFDRTLWDRLRALGWVGAAVPEEYGGTGLGDEGLCVLAEALGGCLAAVPFASSACVVAQAVLHFGDAAQRRRVLPGLADGSVIGAFALAEGAGWPAASGVRAEVRDGRLFGEKAPVVDGGIADLALVVARGADGEPGLYLVQLQGVAREAVAAIDPSRNVARLRFDGAEAEMLAGGRGWSAVERVLERAAVFVAFEQLGGAQAALDAARAYALERHAFGRPIGSFQAIKHKLAEVYVAVELARSNAYYGCWAVGADAPDLATAAAASRVAASRAFELAAAENIQVHGGMGFTWEADAHLFYRRAKHLSLALGAAPYWKERLVGSLERRNSSRQNFVTNGGLGPQALPGSRGGTPGLSERERTI